MCPTVFAGCIILPDLDRSEWWEQHGYKLVLNKITSLRNDRIKAIKEAMYGKKNGPGKWMLSSHCN